MRLLVACEESQAVTIHLREKGHEAYSCDLVPSSGGFPQWHIQEHAINILHSDHWDGVIAFPPCTHLATSGARHFSVKRQDGRQQDAINFFMAFVTWHRLTRKPLAIENPVGIMSTLYRPPNQIIHPWQFGHRATKKTCLWLHKLPRLQGTLLVGPPRKYKSMTHEELAEWTAIHRCPPGPQRSTIRSKTYPGIAAAMASQWF